MKETLKKLKIGPKNIYIFVGFVLLCVGYFLPEWVENTVNVNISVDGQSEQYQKGTNWGLWTQCSYGSGGGGSGGVIAERTCVRSHSSIKGLIEIARACSILSLLSVFLLFISTSYAKNKNFTWLYIISILFTLVPLALLTMAIAGNQGPSSGGSLGKAAYISYLGFAFILVSLGY